MKKSPLLLQIMFTMGAAILENGIMGNLIKKNVHDEPASFYIMDKQ